MQRRFEIRAALGKIVLAILFFTACAAWLGWLSTHDDRGLIIDGIIELGPQGARTFYAALAACSVGFVALAIAQMVRTRGGRLAVIVDDETITVPGSIFRPAVQKIAFAEIRSVSLRRVSGQDLAIIVHPQGRAAITRSWLPDGGFDEILALLAKRVGPAAPLPEARA